MNVGRPFKAPLKPCVQKFSACHSMEDSTFDFRITDLAVPHHPTSSDVERVELRRDGDAPGIGQDVEDHTTTVKRVPGGSNHV